MTRLRKAKAFTLIELIVVVIIIGILAILATVAYNQFIANAQKASAQADAVSAAKVLNASSAADTVSNGNTAVFAKNKNTDVALAATLGLPTSRLWKDQLTPPTVLTAAHVAAFTTNSTFAIGDAAHNCLITFTPFTSGGITVALATVSACK